MEKKRGGGGGWRKSQVGKEAGKQLVAQQQPPNPLLPRPTISKGKGKGQKKPKERGGMIEIRRCQSDIANVAYGTNEP